MTEVRCNNCNELNDPNSIKCEFCKANLVTTSAEGFCSDEDECERDFQFIEEAEIVGQVYKLENLDELDQRVSELKYGSALHSNIPESCIDAVVKLEDDSKNSEDVSYEVVTPDLVGNASLDLNDNATQKNQTEKAAKNTESNEKTGEIKVKEFYKCLHCVKSFKRKASLKAHINRVHNPDDGNGCCAGHAPEAKPKLSCLNTFPSSAFSESCESEFQCSDDDKSAGSQIKHDSQRKRKRKLKLQLKHESPDCENNNNSHKDSSKKCKTELNLKQTKLNEIVYKCAACEKINDSYQEHLKHIVIHEQPDDSLTVKTSLEQLKQTPSGFLECKECAGVFMSEREFKIHQRSHQGVYQCDICKTILLTPSSLRKHKLRMHRQTTTRKTTLFECNICNERYESQLLMLQHRKQHTEVMKKIEEMTIIDRSGQKVAYVCKLCAKTSNNKFRHEEHLRTHTGEKPYKCEKCGISIATSNAMAHHMRTHENVTFDCAVCGATYRHKKSLKKHMKLHTGERPFGCRHCDKTFAFNYTRADHERKCHLDGNSSRMKKSNSLVKRNGTKTKDKSLKVVVNKESEIKDASQNESTDGPMRIEEEESSKKNPEEGVSMV